jgi:hypothetical protein
VFDSADRAAMNAVSSGEVHSTLTPGQGQTNLADLNLQNLRERVPIALQTATVPQAIRQVAGVITDIKILRPVICLVIVAVADKLVAAEQATQDYRHHRAMQQNPPHPRFAVWLVTNDLPGLYVWSVVAVVAQLAKSSRATKP